MSEKICSICQRKFAEFGNSAQPVNDGRCCNRCNDVVVIPARIRAMRRERGKRQPSQAQTEGE